MPGWVLGVADDPDFRIVSAKQPVFHAEGAPRQAPSGCQVSKPGCVGGRVGIRRPRGQNRALAWPRRNGRSVEAEPRQPFRPQLTGPLLCHHGRGALLVKSLPSRPSRARCRYSAVVKRRSIGSRQRVEAARRQAALALGRDPDQRDSFVEPPKASLSSSAAGANDVACITGSRSIGVLSIGEAAARLDLSRSQLEAMIVAGKVAALPTGFTRMIPTTEVERLRSMRGRL